MDIDLNDLYLFAQVVDKNGFTAASDALGIPKSRLSRRVAELESRLGARLLHRTSRKLSVTDAGQALYVHCTAMIQQAVAGQDAVAARQIEPSGTVRISVPVFIADILMGKLLPRFIAQYPKITLVVQVTNNPIDLIAEKIDLLIGDSGINGETSSMVRMNLFTSEWRLMASPAYLERANGIQSLEALTQADTLLFAALNSNEKSMRLTGPGDELFHVPISLKLQSDNLALLMQLCLAGLGVAAMPLYVCNNELRDGTLQVILPAYRPNEGRIVMILPTRTGLAPAVRALVNFLKAELSATLA